MKVGDYVRTDTGQIGKIIGFKGDMVETDNKRLITYKSSHSECKIKERLIELIEVGDYVDGLKVIDIVEHLHGHKDIVMTNGKFQWSTSNDDYDIKSIVTKEQFSQMEYKVGE